MGISNAAYLNRRRAYRLLRLSPLPIYQGRRRQLRHQYISAWRVRLPHINHLQNEPRRLKQRGVGSGGVRRVEEINRRGIGGEGGMAARRAACLHAILSSPAALCARLFHAYKHTA